MSDIAQILGVSKELSSASVVPTPAAPPPAKPPGYQPNKSMQLLGGGASSTSQASVMSLKHPMSVPVVTKLNTMTSSNTSVAASESNIRLESGPDVVKVGNKFISIAKPARKWAWAPFSSSARTDGAIFHHWVRANVEYPDYPYARFDIHLDPVTYNDEEYKSYCQNDSWSKSQTDFLLELARRFELRWPIIHDRWIEAFGIDCSEKIEDLQHRYYSVASKLNAARIAQEAAKEVQHLVASTAASRHDSSGHTSGAPEAILMETAAARALASTESENQPLIQNTGSGTTNKKFDLEYERGRRAHLEALWNRPKEDEVEELEIRKELKLVEAQLRKLKKSGRHVLAAAKGKASGGTLTMPGSTVPCIDPAVLDQAFGSTAPKPVSQVPYLQSGRLAPPATGGTAGINKSLLNRMDEMLTHLKVPAKPIATKRVSDLYDQVRRDALTLLVCQKQVIQKEGIIQSKRLRLAKLGGEGRVVDEDTLLGITPAVPVASSPVARAKTKNPGSGGKTKAMLATVAGVAPVNPGALKSKQPRPAATVHAAVASVKTEASAAAPKSGDKNKDSSFQAIAKKAVKRKRKADAPPENNVPPMADADVLSSHNVAAPSEPVLATTAAPSRPVEGRQSAKKRPKKVNTTS
ncbi:hypothetical protein MPSEU_001062400 [Mayamaea pseudoterrestris]|nr:hypothetical protein MPSEU_001062400 [Mayamaea pseudoterrestris]